uniref:NADH dehydrogenase [ubiquinone] 1 beta subcomplex subunit 6 n=1 Tax=Oncorhynchus tshawytscha TaxID=74940 RepID=A0AAZ3PNB7_ONCTS
MTGYTADEKLRVEQISNLRRKWLKDQELSPREPVLPKTAPGPVAKFWAGFLEPKTLWRLYTYKVYTGGVFALTRLLIPAWVVHYYVKYHVAVSSINSTPIILSFHSCSNVVVRKTCSWSVRGFWPNQTPPGFFQPPHRPNWFDLKHQASQL